MKLYIISDVDLQFFIFLGGSLTRQVEQDASVSDSSPHIANIGKMVEDMENKIRYVMYKILMYIVGIGMVCHCAQTFDKKKYYFAGKLHRFRTA